MKTLTEMFQEIDEMCENVHAGPWRNRFPMIYAAKGEEVSSDVCKISAVFMDRNAREANAKFIAESRTLVPRLKAALVRAIEQRDYLLQEIYMRGLGPRSVAGDKEHLDRYIAKILRGGMK